MMLAYLNFQKPLTLFRLNFTTSVTILKSKRKLMLEPLPNTCTKSSAQTCPSTFQQPKKTTSKYGILTFIEILIISK